MAEKDKKFQTEIWRKYEKCKEYADKKRIVARTEKNWNFYVGDQWNGLQTGGEQLPIFNFIKPIVQYKVSTVAQNAMTAMYSDMDMREEYDDVYESLNKFWSQCWEKAKMNDAAWKILKAAAIQGDSYAYWPDGNTLEPPQVLPNTAVYLSDENIDNIQEQKFIIVRERWNLATVRKLAKENGVSKDEIARIEADNNTDTQIYNKSEVEDKVTVLLYIEKDDDGIVKSGRATETCVIEPLDSKIRLNSNNEVLGKLEVYPIIPYVWEATPNSARGISEVEQLIPNQLELNKTLARRSMAVKMGAYPRLAYDANSIENPDDLDKVGAAIAVNGGNAQSINQMIAYLNPANISSDALQLSSDLLQTTKDLAGASDSALGNINPEQASGTAIIAVRDQAQVPLNEQTARYKQWVEDVSLLWMDLWVVYNEDGISFQYEDEDGNQMPVTITQEQLRELKPLVRIDVSPDNQWTKLAEQQSIDSMLQLDKITLEEYAEMTPANSSVPKQKLMTVINRRKRQEQQAALQQQQMAMQQQAAGQIDPQIVLQELINQGVPEDEANAMVQSL